MKVTYAEQWGHVYRVGKKFFHTHCGQEIQEESLDGFLAPKCIRCVATRRGRMLPKSWESPLSGMDPPPPPRQDRARRAAAEMEQVPKNEAPLAPSPAAPQAYAAPASPDRSGLATDLEVPPHVAHMMAMRKQGVQAGALR